MRTDRAELERLDAAELEKHRALVDDVAAWREQLRNDGLDITEMRARWARRQERQTARAELRATAARVATELKELEHEELADQQSIGDWVRRWRAKGYRLRAVVSQVLAIDDPNDSVRSWLGQISKHAAEPPSTRTTTT